MKITDVLEDVVDLGARREQKRKDEMPDVSIKEAMDNIDETVDLTIQYLQHHGYSEGDAHKLVMKHLSDRVMAHDVSK